MKVSESGYYRRNKRGSKPRARQLLLVEISSILSEHQDNDNYGVERIQTALSQRGIKVSRRTVYRAMHEGGLLHKRRRPHGLTKADTETQDRENLIKRDLPPPRRSASCSRTLPKYPARTGSCMYLLFSTALTARSSLSKCETT